MFKNLSHIVQILTIVIVLMLVGCAKTELVEPSGFQHQLKSDSSVGDSEDQRGVDDDDATGGDSITDDNDDEDDGDITDDNDDEEDTNRSFDYGRSTD